MPSSSRQIEGLSSESEADWLKSGGSRGKQDHNKTTNKISVWDRVIGRRNALC